VLIRRPIALVITIAVATLLAACSPSGSVSPSASASSSRAPSASASTAASAGASAATSPEATPTPTKLVVGLGYIANVQFAPFYLAQQAGYYADAGLTVEFQNKSDPDLIALVGQGAIDIGIGDGTSVIPAVSQGIPVQYVATIYGKFPNVVFAKTSSGIKTAADLKGKKVGTPGRYGSGWIMLQALLGSAGLTTSDIQVVEYPDYTQLAAVQQGAVDAATGYSNNEPVQLEASGTPTSIMTIDSITPLPGPGLIAGTSTIEQKHDAIAGFIAATLKAMKDIEQDPNLGMEAAIKVEPAIANDRDLQSKVLAATIDSWTGPIQQAHGLGAIDTAGWTSSIAYLTTLKLVPNPVTADRLTRTDLLPGD
jgi:NitT/TauT family transport system substrate-binding protein